VRVSRWLIVLPAVLLSFFPFVVRADAVQGLDASYYVINEIPPQQSTSLYTLCASELENNINRSYDGEPVEGCPDDLFLVHLTGFISIPVHESIEFMLASDDGGEITIGGNTFGVWYDQGCTWTMSGNLGLEPGSLPLELFMYENGGSSCLMLAWKIDDGNWEIVPDEAFTTSPTVSTTTTQESTTTTEESTTTSEVSTTTVVESTTSSAPTTTLLEVEPTMPEQSTTSSTTTTTSTTTTSTVVETTTTTEPVSPPPAQPPATVEPPPTTMPAPPDTAPTPPETQPSPPETASQPPATNPTVPPAQTIPFVTSPPDAPQAPETLPIPDTAPPPPETAPAPPDVKEALTVEQFDAVIEQLSEATEEQIVALVDDLITKDLDTSQAAAFVSSPEVLAAITTDQAEALFGEISTAELSVVEAEQVVAAVQDAPPSVRQAFESVLNIFSGFADNYVPFDSRIPVSERRALVALGAVLLAASPAPTLRRRQ
jgi:hypothetical protein